MTSQPLSRDAEIAARLRSWRGDRSQFVLAKRIDTTPQAISGWENERIPQSWRLLGSLADDGCDLHWLLNGKPRTAR